MATKKAVSKVTVKKGSKFPIGVGTRFGGKDRAAATGKAGGGTGRGGA